MFSFFELVDGGSADTALRRFNVSLLSTLRCSMVSHRSAVASGVLDRDSG